MTRFFTHSTPNFWESFFYFKCKRKYPLVDVQNAIF